MDESDEGNVTDSDSGGRIELGEEYQTYNLEPWNVKVYGYNYAVYAPCLWTPMYELT
jgi:hypothetical protein